MKMLSLVKLCLLIGFLCIGAVRTQLTALAGRQKFNASDFVTNAFNQPPVNVGPGATRSQITLEELPPLQGLGVSTVLFTLQPCGINLPHVHPRGTELFHSLQGTFLTGLIEENNGRVILNNVTAGEATVFEQGLVHFELNLSCEPARFLSAFSSDDPGVLTVTTRLFDAPNTVLAASFNIDDQSIENIRSRIAANIGYEECLKRCNITIPI